MPSLPPEYLHRRYRVVGRVRKRHPARTWRRRSREHFEPSYLVHHYETELVVYECVILTDLVFQGAGTGYREARPSPGARHVPTGWSLIFREPRHSRFDPGTEVWLNVEPWSYPDSSTRQVVFGRLPRVLWTWREREDRDQARAQREQDRDYRYGVDDNG